ncbi:MAG: tRNA pseudouridine(38-40) synthase TruA [Verrucomicrobia bacterium]|nr:tRNA pseudouridine(38-40) synthase TruA [Verrucomicrobiota bacterium]
MRVKLTIAYEGTRYSGWQSQKNGISVQQCVEDALATFLPTGIRLFSSSRTDTGVHALGMVAHADVSDSELRMPFAKLPLALNAHLPEDIRIVSAKRVPSSFHARFDALGKQYRYQVWNHFAANPMLRRQVWLVHKSLNFDTMRNASRQFLGKHDFAGFAGTRNYKPKSTVRTVSRCDILRKGPLITFVIEADGFLYKMCRAIVGTLVQIGLGKIEASEIPEMIAKRDRRLAGMTAPAHGLALWRVYYRTSSAKSKCSRSNERRIG